MKKICIVISIGLVSTIINAGQVDWSTSFFRTPGTTTSIPVATDATKVLFLLVYAGGGDISFTYGGGGATFGNDTVLASGKATKNGGISDTIVQSENAPYTTAGLNPGASYDAYLVALYNSSGVADYTHVTHYYVSGKVGTKVPGNWAGTLPGVDNITVPVFAGAVTGGETSWVVVPEPTSLALLAIGVAAIGLRRKFRK